MGSKSAVSLGSDDRPEGKRHCMVRLKKSGVQNEVEIEQN